MSICLIHTPVPELKDDRLDPPMGLLYLGTYLKNRGWKVKIIDLSGIPEPEWDYHIPSMFYYGFSTYTGNYHLTLRLRDIVLSKNPEAITIAGGAHASALPEEVAKDFDYVVIGEGETVIQGILDNYYQPGIIVGEPIKNLDKLPFLDYSLINIKSYHRLIDGGRAIPIFSSRGCLYNCAFCTVKSTVHNRLYRHRSVRHFVGEMVSNLQEFGDIRFRIKDDLFGTNLDWIKEFSQKKPNIKYDCLLRSDFNQNIIPYLSGCDMVSMGVESGSNKILEAMNKKTTWQRSASAIKALNLAGIKTLIWLIVGFPGETWDTVKETVEFVNLTKPDITTIYPLIPYPGTDVYNNKDKYGLKIIDNDFSHYFYIKGNYDSGYVYETDTLNPDIIREMKQYMIENITESEIR